MSPILPAVRQLAQPGAAYPPVITARGGVFSVYDREERDGRCFLLFSLGRWFWRYDRGRIEVSRETFELCPVGTKFFSVRSTER